jgi:hypothetical protein
MVSYTSTIAFLASALALASAQDAAAGCTHTVCIEGVNRCGETYSGCVASCPGMPQPTFSTRPCPAMRATTLSTVTSAPRVVAAAAATACQTEALDLIKACGSTYKRYGGMVTSCPGQPARSDIVEPACETPVANDKVVAAAATAAITTAPACQTKALDMIKKCSNGYKRYGGMVVSCPGQPARSDFTEPACDAPVVERAEATAAAPTPVCETVAYDLIKKCDSGYKRYGGMVTSCPGKPAVTHFAEPACPMPATATATPAAA